MIKTERIYVETKYHFKKSLYQHGIKSEFSDLVSKMTR